MHSLFSKSVSQNPFGSSSVLVFHFKHSSMVSSFDRVSFMDLTTSSITLTVKQNEILINDLDASKYPIVVQQLIKCLNYLILKKELAHHEDVLLSALILTFSTTSYSKSLDVMNFEVQGHKTRVSKANFFKLSGLITSEAH